MRSLIRTQLRLAGRRAARAGAARSARCRCCSLARAGLADVRLLGIPLPWLLLGVRRLPGAVPARLAATSGRPSATSATSPSSSRGPDRVSRPTPRRDRVVAVVAGRRRDAGDRRLRAADLPHHQRLLRRLAHGRAAAQRLARSAASTSRPRPSSASPGWCSPTAPTCSGTRSAGPPATWCCWCWSPRRCAARAPTRCPTSPRPGSSRARSARRRALLVVAIGWLYLLPQFQGAGLTLSAATGAPDAGSGGRWSRVVVLVNVVSGGMRSITFVQAFQYWLKLTALLVPGVLPAGASGPATARPTPPAPADRRDWSARCRGAAAAASTRRTR